MRVTRSIFSYIIRYRNHNISRKHISYIPYYNKFNATLYTRIASNFTTSAIKYKDEAVTTPGFPDSVSEGDIRWIKSVGDPVDIDDIVCEIETDKTAIPVPSPFKGFLKSQLIEEGGKVKPHQQLYIISDNASAETDNHPPDSKEPHHTPEQEQNFKTQPEKPDLHEEKSATNSLLISVPQLPESVSEGDLKWLKAVGDSVDIDEPICEIETDKTAVPVPSPIKGIISEIKVEDGAKVTSKTPLCLISESNSDSSKPQSSLNQQFSTASELIPPIIPTTPHLVSFTETDKTDIPSGKVVKPAFFDDLIPEKKQQVTSQFEQGSVPSKRMTSDKKKSTEAIKVVEDGSATTDFDKNKIGGTRTETKVKMNRMRKRIAERLKQAQNTAAMLTTFNEVDMSSIIAVREKHKEQFSKVHEGLKLGFVSFFVHASTRALMRQPIVNAFVTEDNSHIMYRDYIDISVAVATPKGLVVPVIRSCEGMSVADIEKNMATLSDKARKGALAIEDMDGGTFTISNGGVFGSLMGTPIINLPQSAILGMHAIQKRPVVINDKIEIRPMMYLALTYDHRLIDGREAVTFLKAIKNYIEDPASIFLDI